MRKSIFIIALIISLVGILGQTTVVKAEKITVDIDFTNYKSNEVLISVHGGKNIKLFNTFNEELPISGDRVHYITTNQVGFEGGVINSSIEHDNILRISFEATSDNYEIEINDGKTAESAFNYSNNIIENGNFIEHYESGVSIDEGESHFAKVYLDKNKTYGLKTVNLYKFKIFDKNGNVVLSDTNNNFERYNDRLYKFSPDLTGEYIMQFENKPDEWSYFVEYLLAEIVDFNKLKRTNIHNNEPYIRKEELAFFSNIDSSENNYIELSVGNDTWADEHDMNIYEFINNDECINCVTSVSHNPWGPGGDEYFVYKIELNSKNKNTTTLFRIDSYFDNISNYDKHFIHIKGYTGGDKTGFNSIEEVRELSEVPSQSESFVEDPIDTSTGAMVETKELLSYQSANPLKFVIKYNSLTTNNGNMGYGWYHNHEAYLEKRENEVEIHWNPNRSNVFNINEDGSYTPVHYSMEYNKLEKNTDGNFIFQDKDNSKYIFNSQGQLIQYKTNRDFETNYTYDENGFLTEIHQPLTGHKLFFEYRYDDLLEAVSDNLGREVSFSYNYKDNLRRITDANDKDIRLEYNDYHQILTMENNEEEIFLRNEYDPFGRVVKQYDGKGNFSTFEYDDYSYEDKIITKFTKRDGTTQTLIHNNNYQLIEKINELGVSTKFEYDEFGNQIAEIDGNGNRGEFVYNADGNLIETHSPDGSVIYYEYDDFGNVKKVIDGEGNITQNTYDEYGQLVSTTNALNNQAHYIYNTLGQPLEITDARGNKTTYTYENGLVKTISDKENNTTTFVHDDVGRVIKTTLPDGAIFENTYDNNDNIIKQTDNDGNFIEKTYDSRGNILTETDKLGRVTTYVYDDNDNLISETIGDRTKTYKYDKEDRLIEETDGNGNKTTYTYDDLGQLLSETDAKGNTIAYTYDNNGNTLTATINDKYTTTYTYDTSDRVISETNAEGQTTTYEYDNTGQLVKEINPLGYATTYQYDGVGNLIKETDANGNSIIYTYDKNGNVLTMTDANGNTNSYEYDKNNRLVKEINALNQEKTYQYNENGKLHKVFNHLGEVITTNEYNDLGQLVSITDGLNHSRTFEYDKVGNLVKTYDGKGNLIEEVTYNQFNEPITVTNSLGHTVSYDYDNAGNTVEIVDALNRIQSFDYNSINQLVKITDKDGVDSTQSFNDLNLLESFKDPNQNQTIFTYNKLGQILSETNATGNSLTYQYNNASWLSQKVNARNQETNIYYDKIGNIIKTVDNHSTIEYTYDNNYNIIEIKETGKNPITYEYDALNRITKYTDEYGNTISYEYDDRGHLSKLIYPDGKEVNYVYDVMGNLLSVTDWNNHTTTYEYDENNHLVKTIKPDGSIETREYNTQGWLVLLETKDKNGNIISSDDFEYDKAGNVIREGDEYFTYDNLDRLTSSNNNTYSYDNAGNILEHTNTITNNIINYAYGSDNRLTDYNGQSLSYDADGNLLSIPVNQSLQNAEYDVRNRLISLNNITYGYNAENNRTSITKNGVETRFVINNNADLNQVLMETDSSGNPINYYVYGVGLISKEDANGNKSIYHYDRRGSTIALTDMNGVITDTYEYDMYGEILEKVGSTDNRFLYNGKYGVMTDDNGLYFMRNRYYHPELKRFINRDVVQGNLQSPQTFNRYAYVNGNPVSYIDPFGLSRELDDRDNRQNELISESVHLLLDGVGIIPIVGDVVDGLHGAYYLSQGRYVEAGVSFISMIPIVGDVAKGGKWITKGALFINKSKDSIKSGFDKLASGTKSFFSKAKSLLPWNKKKKSDIIKKKKKNKELLQLDLQFFAKKKKPYSNPKNRPKYGKNQVEEVWEEAKDYNGRVFDPNTGKELFWDKTKSRAGQWDMGHTKKNKYSIWHKKYMDGKISKEGFLKWYRDKDNYKPEDPSSNRSHKHE